jgi:exodeoxyribonuclease-3
MNRLSLATWNINSVRLRIDRVIAFLKREKPDVLCLQEIKCLDDQFPRKAFEAAGYKHIHLSGQKGMHGVAIVSKLPIKPLETPGLCRHGHARCAAVEVAGFEVQNLYVPAGADIPDPELNEKFAHKLDFVERMRRLLRRPRRRNVPPCPCWSPATSTSRPKRTTSGRIASCSTWSATRPSKPMASSACSLDGKLTDIARAKHKPTRSSTPGGAIAPPTGSLEPRPPSRSLVGRQARHAAGRHRQLPDPSRRARRRETQRPRARHSLRQRDLCAT